MNVPASKDFYVASVAAAIQKKGDLRPLTTPETVIVMQGWDLALRSDSCATVIRCDRLMTGLGAEGIGLA